jgi:outer membrane immunogenic protein
MALAGVGLLAPAGMIGPVSAADMGRPVYRAPPPVYYPPIYNWTGFYAGVNGGYGWGSTNWSALGSSFDVKGGLFGGQVGYNWQFGQFVYGLEGDIDWTDISGSTNCFGLTCQTKNSWLGTVRGRVGYAWDRFMPYFTGGAAFGDIKATVPAFVSSSSTNVGWTVGGGVEGAIAGNWTAKVDLGDTTCSALACGVATNVDLRTSVLRAGVNYRF